jgi:unsaturated rhamnogalacturonyl hydrolase
MANFTVGGKAMLQYAREACDTLMNKFAPEALPPAKHFHYHQGVFLSGMMKTYQHTGEERYFDYVKAWVDSQVDWAGNISWFNPGQLDDLQPGILLFPLLARTGDTRYRTALDTIAYYMEHFARNPEGGFWHKAWYRNQMWLDGLYMAGPFCAEYAKAFDKPAFFDLVVEQAEMMIEKTRDAATGLCYHAYDYEKLQRWANPETGCSPEFWGRAIGWVAVALLDDLDYLPAGHPGRKALSDMAVALIRALLPYQDGETGLWHQVVDKGGQAGNWVETSCSCLYAAALCKAVRLGLMEADLLDAARRACEGVARYIDYDDKGLLLSNVCVGTGVGDYQHYCDRPTGTNDLHGVGAFLILCAEMEAVGA